MSRKFSVNRWRTAIKIEQNVPFLLLGVLAVGVVGVVILAATTKGDTQALSMGFAALFGLCSIAFTQFLNARSALARARNERLEEARGLAHALAAEVSIFGHVLLAKGHTLSLMLKPGAGVETENGLDPDDVLQFVELPSRVIFDASATKIALLEVIEEYGELSEQEGGLVGRVVGFYEGFADFRAIMADAKLQGRKVTAAEIDKIEKQLQDRAKFALDLSKRLNAFIRLSEKPTRTGS